MKDAAIPVDERVASAALHEHRSVRRAIAYWLLACCMLLFAMVVVGGVTRLTHSGLSIVEWKPFIGTVPPLNAAEWQAEFQKYQLTPEFKLRNFNMGVEEFKGIFWWEYFHRLLGRIIGAIYLVPLLFFSARGAVKGQLSWKLWGIFVLGGLQGAMGWYMVQSGLVDEPRVSHLRLTVHLGLAFLIFAAQFWVALDLLFPRSSHSAVPAGLRRLSLVVLGLVFMMVLLGGLVAGLRAGLAYNTFPLMHGHFVPPDMFLLEPWYRNFLGNMATVQFDHRMGAWALLILIPALWWSCYRHSLHDRARLAAHALLVLLVVQFSLGVATLLMSVPVGLGAAHQGGALLLFAAALALAHELA